MQGITAMEAYIFRFFPLFRVHKAHIVFQVLPIHAAHQRTKNSRDVQRVTANFDFFRMVQRKHNIPDAVDWKQRLTRLEIDKGNLVFEGNHQETFRVFNHSRNDTDVTRDKRPVLDLPPSIIVIHAGNQPVFRNGIDTHRRVDNSIEIRGLQAVRRSKDEITRIVLVPYTAISGKPDAPLVGRGSIPNRVRYGKILPYVGSVCRQETAQKGQNLKQ